MRAALLTLVALLLSSVLALPQADHTAARNETNPRYDYAELSKASEKARMRRNPLEGDAYAVAGGKKLFEQHCAECHGAAGEGGKKAPSLNTKEVQEATPGTLFWLLTNGVVRRGMPVWSKLPEAQRWQLVMYLRTLKMEASKTDLLKTETK
jgi:mono/diheme cytochrome c family protein